MKSNLFEAALFLAVTLLCASALSAQTAKLNPAYLSEMPAVDQVLSAMQTAGPDETAARQMGAFMQLNKMIGDMAGPRLYNRANGLTPDEERLRQQYYAAYSKIMQSKPQYKSFTAMRGYDVSVDFRNALFQKLFPPTFAAEYAKDTGQANAQFQAVHQARLERDQHIQLEAVQAAQAEAQKKYNTDAKAALDVTRCLSTGKSEAECSLRTFGKGINDVLGGSGIDPSAAKTVPAPFFAFFGEYPGEGKLMLKSREMPAALQPRFSSQCRDTAKGLKIL